MLMSFTTGSTGLSSCWFRALCQQHRGIHPGLKQVGHRAHHNQAQRDGDREFQECSRVGFMRFACGSPSQILWKAEISAFTV
jgi:hypothetical protein